MWTSLQVTEQTDVMSVIQKAFGVEDMLNTPELNARALNWNLGLQSLLWR